MWEQGGSKDIEIERPRSEMATLYALPPQPGTKLLRCTRQIFIHLFVTYFLHLTKDVGKKTRGTVDVDKILSQCLIVSWQCDFCFVELVHPCDMLFGFLSLITSHFFWPTGHIGKCERMIEVEAWKVIFHTSTLPTCKHVLTAATMFTDVLKRNVTSVICVNLCLEVLFLVLCIFCKTINMW